MSTNFLWLIFLIGNSLIFQWPVPFSSCFSRQATRGLSRIYGLEKSRVAEGDEFPRGVREYAPPEIFGNEYVLRCNLVHFETQF